jgi:hypothetical protein
VKPSGTSVSQKPSPRESYRDQAIAAAAAVLVQGALARVVSEVEPSASEKSSTPRREGASEDWEVPESRAKARYSGIDESGAVSMAYSEDFNEEVE